MKMPKFNSELEAVEDSLQKNTWASFRGEGTPHRKR